MTVEELLDAVYYRYSQPSSSAGLVEFMNTAQRELGEYFDVEVTGTISTTEDVDEYAFPTGCTDISQIMELGVSKSTTPTDRYDYIRYEKTTRDDYPKSHNGYYQITDNEGGKYLVVYPVPTESDLIISVRYKRPMVDLVYSDDDQVPEFDPRHHMLLVYYAIRELASSGDTPDTLQADHWGRRWEIGVRELARDKMVQKIRHPLKRRDNPQWHGARGYVAGEIPVEPGGV